MKNDYALDWLARNIIELLAIESFSMVKEKLGKVDIEFHGDGKKYSNASHAMRTDYKCA